MRVHLLATSVRSRPNPVAGQSEASKHHRRGCEPDMPTFLTTIFTGVAIALLERLVVHLVKSATRTA
ncbi:hypothetical protein GCM10027597_45130 [Saccharopolyspora tripterygii]